MTATDPRNFIQDLYKVLLGRIPTQEELQPKIDAAVRGMTPEQLFYSFVQCDEYKMKNRVTTTFPIGHYHSPIVNPDEVRVHLKTSQKLSPTELSGIDIDIDLMASVWRDNARIVATTPFTRQPEINRRYYFGEGPYPLGDATILRLMMAVQRPRRVVEIGSGFSSACILDCADDLGLSGLSLTCIEPFPDRLRSLLKPGDAPAILAQPVQATDLSVFAALEANDILLIDSTHVMKTGSDVNYELFSVLPVLKPGVLIHVHDCQFPFEYPDLWVLDHNYSWNEVYGLRAFLMYNSRYKIYFWNSLFAQQRTELARSVFPDYLINPGSAIWLKVGSDVSCG